MSLEGYDAVMPKTATIDKVYGIVSDRSGIEIDRSDFYSLVNVDNRNLQEFKERLGVIKWASETHAAGASTKVLNLFRYDDGTTQLDIKITQDGKVYKHAVGSGSWTEITASAPSLATTNTFIAQLNTRDTGASASTGPSTLDRADTTTVTLLSATYTVNAHAGRILEVASTEKKLIAANNATKIYVKERFDDVPSGTFNVYPRAIEFFIANGTNFYKCDGTTFTRLDNTTQAYAFTGIVNHNERIHGWIGSRQHWSDAGVGEQFSRNAWRDYASTIQVGVPLKEILIMYEKTRVTAQFGDSPDNYQWKEVLSTVGTDAPKSVASYTHLQFFLNNKYGVCVLSAERLSPTAKLEPLSVSKNFLNDDILNHTTAQLQAACGTVYDGKYFLCIAADWYILHIEESLAAPRDEDGNIRWIWTKRDYPTAIDANCLGSFGTSLVAGSASTGQVYEMDVASTYTDDSTAIALTIEKRDWQIEGKQVKQHQKLKVSQALSASSIEINYYFVAGGSSYGSADGTVNLSTAASAEHDIVVPASLTTPKDIGQRISFKITKTGSLGCTAFEEFSMLYETNALV